MNEAKHSWDKHWLKYNLSLSQDRQIINQELCSVRWKKIEQIIIKKFSGIAGLKAIEIGSGRGELSALLALKGAQVTLVDYSQEALAQAEALFEHVGVRGDFITSDIMSLSHSLLSSFDISISSGFAEHFDYPLRREIIKLHVDLVNPGGIAFIAAPNAYCLPYRLFLKLQEVLGYSRRGEEIPFSRREFKAIAGSLGFEACEIMGSSFIRDTFYFLVSRYVSHFSQWRIILNTSRLEISSFMDDYFGYSLVLTLNKNDRK